MNLNKFTSIAAALSLTSSALAIDIVYEDFFDSFASWTYVDDPTNTPSGEAIGSFFYATGPRVIDPTFNENESYRWTIDAIRDLDHTIEFFSDPVAIPGFPTPSGPVLTTSNQNSVQAAHFSFVASTSELLSLIGLSPVNALQLITTGLSGSATLDDLQSTLNTVDPNLAELFSAPAGINAEAITAIGTFGLANGSGSLLLDGEIPGIVSTTGDIYLSLAVTAERLETPVNTVPDTGSSAAFIIVGLATILTARRKTQR